MQCREGVMLRVQGLTCNLRGGACGACPPTPEQIDVTAERPSETVLEILLRRDVTGSLWSPERALAPTPLDLAEIPMFRAVQSHGEPDADGNLPREACYVECGVRDLSGAEFRLEISGSPKWGLPLATDADILLAILRMIDQEGLGDGAIRDASFRAVADAMDIEYGGRLATRIHEGLRRLSQVSILGVTTREADDVAEEVRSGRGTARTPSTAVYRSQREQARTVLEYDVDREETRSGEEMRIRHLQVSSFWVSQAIAGWTAWIDVPLHNSMRGPLEKALYRLAAAKAARGAPAPWTWDPEDLQIALGIPPSSLGGKGAARVRRAIEKLIELDILASGVTRGRQRNQIIELEPGQLLRDAAYLRGLGLLDLRQLRVQVAALHALGLPVAEARAMTLEDSGYVHDLLLHVLFTRQQQPGSVKNWPAYVKSAFAGRWSFAGNRRFEAWKGALHRARIADDGLGLQESSLELPRGSADEPAIRGRAGPEHDGRAGVPKGPAGRDAPGEEARVERCQVRPRSEAAADLWADIQDQVLERVIAEVGESRAGLLAAIQAVAAWDLENGTLVLVDTSPFILRSLTTEAELVARILSEVSGGRATGFRTATVQDVGAEVPE